MIGAGGADTRPEVLTVVGPTAVGKTSVAIALARAVGGEIVSADSRQIYRWMDIGTAKPTAAERARARHHLIDIVRPSESYDAARFAADAESAIAQLIAEGKTPVVAGGTGLYIESLFEGLFEGVGRFPDVREILTERAKSEGVPALHAELAQVDPESASRVHENDTTRVIRALEVFLATGRALSDWQREPPRRAAYRARYVGLRLEREQLVERMDCRVATMMEDGLLAEIEELVATGRLASGMPGASAVGYRELLPIVEEGGRDETAIAEAVEQIKTNTRRYAKRQMTWFRSVEGIEWFDTEGTDADELAERVLSSRRPS